MKQVGMEQHWLELLRQYVRPLQEHVFLGYTHDVGFCAAGRRRMQSSSFHFMPLKFLCASCNFLVVVFFPEGHENQGWLRKRPHQRYSHAAGRVGQNVGLFPRGIRRAAQQTRFLGIRRRKILLITFGIWESTAVNISCTLFCFV